MNCSVLVKGRAFELGEVASAIVRRLSIQLDQSEGEILDAMVRAFGDAEDIHANFARYIAGDALTEQLAVRPVAGVGTEEGHFVQTFVEEDYEANLQILEGRWRMNGGKVVSKCLRLSVEWFGPNVPSTIDEEIPF